MSVPVVSVVMSVYNGELYLHETVRSILEQTFTDFKFIIVDDGSVDSTWQILTMYAAQDARIVLIRNGENIGIPRSTNKGLACARGKYIARTDADDVSWPERLARQVNFLEAHPEVGVLGSAMQIIDGDGNRSHICRFPAEHSVLKWRLCFENPIVHSTVMMRRELVNRVNGYNTEMEVALDYDLWRRLSYVTRLSNLQDVLLYLRKHGTRVTKLHFAEQQQNCIRVSQLMMSGILDEDIPVEIVQCLWKQGFQTSNEVRQVANLIYRLCQASVADSALSRTEKRMIRRDAANRLLSLARPRMRDVHMWGVVALAYRLDPSQVQIPVVGPLWRIVHRAASALAT